MLSRWKGARRLVVGAVWLAVICSGCNRGKESNLSVAVLTPIKPEVRAIRPHATANRPIKMLDADVAVPPSPAPPLAHNGLSTASGEWGEEGHWQLVNWTQHTDSEEGTDFDPDVDSSGEWMVIASTRNSIRPHLYLKRVNGVTLTQLSGGDVSDVQPDFSPDGSTIAFTSDRAGQWDIWTIGVDGTNLMPITNDPAAQLHPSFSPDGKQLVFCSQQAPGRPWELWVVNLAGSRQKRFIGYGLFPTISPDPDNPKIVYQRARQRGGRWYGIWSIDLIDGEAQRATEIVASSHFAAVRPTFSPDGSRIAYSVIYPSAEGKGGRPQEVWTVDLDGRNQQRVAAVGNSHTPAWATGGRIYFCSSRSGTDNIWSVHAGRESPPADPYFSDTTKITGSGDEH